MSVQKEDLARIYRVFQRLGPKGLDPVADLFRKHVEAEGMQRVKEATEAAAAKKEKGAGAHRVLGLKGRLSTSSPLPSLLHTAAVFALQGPAAEPWKRVRRGRRHRKVIH